MSDGTEGIVDNSLGIELSDGEPVDLEELGCDFDKLLISTVMDEYANVYYLLEFPAEKGKSRSDIAPGL